MKAAFIITGLSEYRLFGPVIDCALSGGWQVECWHDYGRPRTGPKSYLFPDVTAAPQYQHGLTAERPFANPAELMARLERGTMDVVVSTRPIQFFRLGAAPKTRTAWVCVQELLDTFLNHSPDALESCDLIALQTPWWTNWAASFYASGSGAPEVASVHARLSRRAAYVGAPELDARQLIDREAVRRRWGIPPDKPVVLLLPFPQGIGQSSFWPKRVFGEPSRSRRLLRVATHGQFKYWAAAWRDESDRAVVRAVRAFCDRNGAFLLVKSRRKTPIPEYTRAVADRCVYDETYYPPTILEALSVASVCVSFYSASVLEAAAMGVPNVCITFSADDYFGGQKARTTSFARFFTPEEGGAFQFRGVSRAMTIREAIAELPGSSLADFAMDPDARREYVRTFIGEDDCRAAPRLVDAIERSIGSTLVAVRGHASS